MPDLATFPDPWPSSGLLLRLLGPEPSADGFCHAIRVKWARNLRDIALDALWGVVISGGSEMAARVQSSEKAIP